MRERPLLFSGPMVRGILEDRKTQTRRVINPQPEFLQIYEHKGVVVYDRSSRSWCWKGKAHGRYPDEYGPSLAAMSPYGVPGDRLWIRETVSAEEDADGTDGVRYRADDVFRPIENGPTAAERWLDLHHYGDSPAKGRYRRGANVPGIHMPRWACRLVLELTEVRVERLQDISEADARAEGISFGPSARHGEHDPRWILGRCRDCRHWDTNLQPNGGKRSSCDYRYSECSDPQPSYGDAGQGCSTSFALSDGTDETARFQFSHFWDHLNGGRPGCAWADNCWVWVLSFRRVEADAE